MNDQKSTQPIRDHRWYRYRNQYGEVVACVKKIQTVDALPTSLAVGFAFSNPLDFNLPRAVRVQKGQGLSHHRMEINPIIIELPKQLSETFNTLTKDTANSSMYRVVRDYLSFASPRDGSLKIRKYEGVHEGDFMNWFWKFKRELKK